MAKIWKWRRSTKTSIYRNNKRRYTTKNRNSISISKIPIRKLSRKTNRKIWTNWKLHKRNTKSRTSRKHQYIWNNARNRKKKGMHNFRWKHRRRKNSKNNIRWIQKWETRKNHIRVMFLGTEQKNITNKNKDVSQVDKNVQKETSPMDRKET